MPDKTEDRFQKIKEKIINKKETAEKGTSSSKSTITSSHDKNHNYYDDSNYTDNNSLTTSTSTSTFTNTSTSVLQNEILELDKIRQIRYDAKDLKYASWQFTKETLRQIKRKAEDLNVHQSQLMRYIVAKAFEEFL